MKIAPLVNGAYFSEVVNNPDMVIALAKVHLHGVKFDTLIGTGLSGGMIVPLMGKSMHKHYALMRKPNDGSHASYSHYAGKIGTRFVFVDDFISTGHTWNRVLTQLHDVAASNPGHPLEYVGTLTYSDSSMPAGFHADYKPYGYQVPANLVSGARQ